MKTVILAGGLGSRLSEETRYKPKPMVEIGGYPILWHIMKIYSHYGYNDFIICCGYKGIKIKEYFANYFMYNSDLTFNMSENSMKIHNKRCEPWNVTLVDTGHNTMTGGRLKRIKEFLQDDESFFFTYGDGVGSVNISNLLEFHNSHGKKVTLTSATPPGRFGALCISNNEVTSFDEKPELDDGFINAGFFVLSSSVLDIIEGDSTMWEDKPLRTLAKSGQLMAYSHKGFWQPMDTLRDKLLLDQLWDEGKAPWKVW